MTDQPRGPAPGSANRPNGPAAGSVWSIGAIVVSILAVLTVPILFGPPAAIAAGVAKWRHEHLSTWAVWFAVAGLVGGTLLNVALYSSG
jgi:hypothetical protein